MTDVPNLVRVMLQVSDSDKANDFYSKLLGLQGRPIAGGREYFDCGSVILAFLNPTNAGRKAKPAADYIYFSVKDLEKIYERARELGCLSTDKIHDESAGKIVTRPWGERSFYVEDPFGNRLCFVAEETIFTGR